MCSCFPLEGNEGGYVVGEAGNEDTDWVNERLSSVGVCMHLHQFEIKS